MTKQEIRSIVRQRKQQLLSASRLTAAAGQLQKSLQEHAAFSAAKTVLLYWAMPDEVPTQHIVEAAFLDKIVLLPVVQGADMMVRRYRGLKQLEAGAYGILEPTGEDFADLASIDLVLVPGVAFDYAGHRCGHGKGYYDKWLAQPAVQNIYTLGVAFDFQCFDSIPTDAHDRKLQDLIIV